MVELDLRGDCEHGVPLGPAHHLHPPDVVRVALTLLRRTNRVIYQFYRTTVTLG